MMRIVFLIFDLFAFSGVLAQLGLFAFSGLLAQLGVFALLS